MNSCCSVTALAGNPRFSFVEGDLRAPDDLARAFAFAAGHPPDAAIHLAALAGVQPSLAEPARFADVNVTGTIADPHLNGYVDFQNGAFSIPEANTSFTGMTTRSPGTCANHDCRLCECCGPWPQPRPIIMRITSGTRPRPPNM